MFTFDFDKEKALGLWKEDMSKKDEKIIRALYAVGNVGGWVIKVSLAFGAIFLLGAVAIVALA